MTESVVTDLRTLFDLFLHRAEARTGELNLAWAGLRQSASQREIEDHDATLYHIMLYGAPQLHVELLRAVVDDDPDGKERQ